MSIRKMIISKVVFNIYDNFTSPDFFGGELVTLLGFACSFARSKLQDIFGGEHLDILDFACSTCEDGIPVSCAFSSRKIKR